MCKWGVLAPRIAPPPPHTHTQRMAPKESKPNGHKTCADTPPIHNQEGSINNYSATLAQCKAGVFT